MKNPFTEKSKTTKSIFDVGFSKLTLISKTKN